MTRLQITEWCQHFMELHVKQGALCIDATAGRGGDTLLLCQLVGDAGMVYAFDIQQEAIDATKEKLKEYGLLQRAEVILDSHVHMDRYVKPSTADCIVFNFGYLPGGDHRLSTTLHTSIHALELSLALLKKGGIISLCIYSGGDTGFEEKEGLLQYLKELKSREYLVIVSQYYNRPNHPPIPVLIMKL